MPQVIVTIDTEIGELSKYVPNSFETFVEGKVDGKEVGYRFILDMLEQYGAKGEFFVDIYAHDLVGEHKFVTLCNTIHLKGHRVQLHTHPSMAFDTRRSYLHQYSLEEQIEILFFGANKIREWIGVYPTAHRAGMYGINKDTFEALEKVGIFYDCSWFYGHRNCKLTCSTKNRPFRIGNVTEIPVTVFKQNVTVRNPVAILRDFFLEKRMSQSLIRREKFQKLDIRYGATLEEIKKVIVESTPETVIVLFLHSFNFLDLAYNFRKKKYESIRVSNGLIKNFEELLSWITTQENCRFGTIDGLRIDYDQQDAYIEVDSPDNVSLTEKAVSLFKACVLHKRDL